MRRPPLHRASILALVALAPLLASCGLAESVAEGFVDGEQVILDARVDRCGTLVRTSGGGDVEARPGFFEAGDDALGRNLLCVLGFAIDATRQPGDTEIDRVRLQIWVEPLGGDPAALGPILVSHLPEHPDALLTIGQVPHPPGDDVGSVDDVDTTGWRTIDVTAAFLRDWRPGRSISAFAVRLAAPTDGDLNADSIAIEGTDEGRTVRARLILDFSLDL